MLSLVMRRRLWASAGFLLVGCGGATTDNSAQHSAVPDGGPEADGGSVQFEACEDVMQHGVDLLTSAIAGAPKTCSTDDECRLYLAGAKCVYVCGIEIALTDATSVQHAVEQVNATICTDACVPNPAPSCGGGREPQIAKCVAGECAATPE